MRGLLIAALIMGAGAARTETPDAAAGEWYFDRYCAACHGDTAMGDGEIQDILTVPAPDLTRLTAENDGVFPVFRVVSQIDGREPLLSHGGEMPLFGHLFDFSDAVIATDTGQPIITAQPIADLAAWLESIQE